MKIRLKLTLLFAGLFAILLMAFSIVVYLSAADQREEEYFKRLRQLAITKTRLLVEAKIDPAVLQLIYKSSLNTLPQEEVAIFDTSFHILYHDANDIDRVKETTGMIDSIKTMKEIHFYVDDLQAIGFLHSFDGKTYAITAAARDVTGLKKLNTLRITLLIGNCAAILFTLLAGMLFARKALKPVSTMVDRVADISASRLDLRLGTGNGKDEIAELAITFNRMLDRLEASFDGTKQFVSNISHELRTPLAALIAELEIAAMKARTTEEYKQVIGTTLLDARRLSRLSTDLLDLAKASYDQSGINYKELRLDEVLLDARKETLKANPRYHVDIHFAKELEEGDPVTIRGNEYLLRVAFINLIENACKFSANHTCAISIGFDANDLLLKFSDQGIGIPTEDIAHIFTPFYRGENKRHAPGNGIGLSLTSRIIQLHSGSIAVESETGKGTTFSIHIPYSIL
ncbi:MAG: HAMP domain-containing protein [Bacteroidetes bacterium]|nr:HAMP domain-containing protein [Bacteroidota bacterium]